MSCSTCGRRSLFADLSRAAAKLAGSQFRRTGALRTHPEWAARATTCEFCPIRVIHRGKTYCGQPFLQKVNRSAEDGCGCPITEKAKDPGEHCPVDSRHHEALKIGSECNCKWCAAVQANAEAQPAGSRSAEY